MNPETILLEIHQFVHHFWWEVSGRFSWLEIPTKPQGLWHISDRWCVSRIYICMILPCIRWNWELGKLGKFGKLLVVEGCWKMSFRKLWDVGITMVIFGRLRPCLQRIVIDFQSRDSSHSCHSWCIWANPRCWGCPFKGAVRINPIRFDLTGPMPSLANLLMVIPPAKFYQRLKELIQDGVTIPPTKYWRSFVLPWYNETKLGSIHDFWPRIRILLRHCEFFVVSLVHMWHLFL